MLNESKLKGPWRITFDTNPDQCNLHCIMCEEHSNYNANKKIRNRTMNFRIIEKVIENTVDHGLKEVIPSTMGEPLLYKKFTDLIELIKINNLKLNITTNGTFPKLGVELWGNLILPVASDTKISINGTSKNINELIMEGINFEKQINNIKEFIKIRDEIRKEGIIDPTITFQATFMESNLEEMPQLIKMAINMNIDRFKGHHLWITHPELKDESLRLNKSAIIRWNNTLKEVYLIVENKRLKNGKRIKLDNLYAITYNHKNEVIPMEYICPFLGREAWIAWDGTFNVCCAPDNFRKTLGDFGNVKQNKFMELWNSENYEQLVNNWGSYNLCKICNMRKPMNEIGGFKHE